VASHRLAVIRLPGVFWQKHEDNDNDDNTDDDDENTNNDIRRCRSGQFNSLSAKSVLAGEKLIATYSISV
jgi:hypothetical protein